MIQMKKNQNGEMLSKKVTIFFTMKSYSCWSSQIPFVFIGKKNRKLYMYSTF